MMCMPFSIASSGSWKAKERSSRIAERRMVHALRPAVYGVVKDGHDGGGHVFPCVIPSSLVHHGQRGAIIIEMTAAWFLEGKVSR